jgi:hypothetical protein
MQVLRQGPLRITKATVDAARSPSAGGNNYPK